MLESIDATAITATEYLPFLSNIWEHTKSIANSNFTAALAGALGGALAAQRIAERGKIKDEITKELHNVNSALALSVSCASLSMALKKQHIKALKDSYDKDIKNFETYKIDRRNGETDQPFTLIADLKTLNKISPPIAIILDIVMNRLSMAGRGIAAAAALSDYIENLNDVILRRNELIDSFKNNRLPEGAKFEDLYLGLPYGNNQTNNEYGDTVSAIHLYTNDIIFFSAILCEDLQEHAATLNRTYKKILSRTPPSSSKADFSEARKNGFIPSNAEYEPWLSGFPRKTQIKLTWWQRITSRS